MRPGISAAEAHRRLNLVFPKAAFDTVHSNPTAAMAVAAMVYVDAVAPDGDEPPRWARPTTCLWMSEGVLIEHGDLEERVAWAAAAQRGKKALAVLLRTWGESFDPAYADNTRETLRDETFSYWREHGALRKRHGVPTNSSAGTWALTAGFADLFDPSLQAEDLLTAIESWREQAMSPEARLKTVVAEKAEQRTHHVTVVLPDGTSRDLEPGLASMILKGVVEGWAPNRLTQPVVLTISEPGDKVFTADSALLARLGLRLDPSQVLPDALVVDIGRTPAEYWLIEAVATDGPVDEARKRRLEQWASEQGINPRQCRFLSAFLSRNDPAARRRLKDLAVGSFAWYLDEPTSELAWTQLVRA